MRAGFAHRPQPRACGELLGWDDERRCARIHFTDGSRECLLQGSHDGQHRDHLGMWPELPGDEEEMDGMLRAGSSAGSTP